MTGLVWDTVWLEYARTSDGHIDTARQPHCCIFFLGVLLVDAEEVSDCNVKIFTEMFVALLGRCPMFLTNASGRWINAGSDAIFQGLIDSKINLH